MGEIFQIESYSIYKSDIDRGRLRNLLRSSAMASSWHGNDWDSKSGHPVSWRSPANILFYGFKERSWIRCTWMVTSKYYCMGSNRLYTMCAIRIAKDALILICHAVSIKFKIVCFIM